MSEILNLYNIFMYTAILSTVLYIIKMLLFLLTGGDVEVESNFDTIAETDTSFSFVSFQSILAFLMGFGWSGLACAVQFNTSYKAALLVGIIVGLAFMFLSAYLMFSIKKLNKKITLDYTTLTDKEGKAYINIPAKKEGQIEINFNNRLSILEAVNDDNEDIPAFSAIKVVRVQNNKIYVTKI